MIIDAKQADALERVITALKQGGVVAIPTETVYGLAGDATNPAAIEKIYAFFKVSWVLGLLAV